MKKIVVCILIAVLLLTPVINCFAASETDIVWEYADEQKTVIFESDTAYTADEQKYIADILVFGESENDGIELHSLCWLTGHKKKTEYVTVITHKVSTSVPRCLEEFYEVTTCEKCNYQEETLLSRGYIACCPAD